jgi:outer membrane lipoprotein-sorting protein
MMLGAFFSTVAVLAAETALSLGAAPVAIEAASTARPIVASAPKSAENQANLAAAVPANEPAKVFAGVSDEAVAAQVLGHIEGLTTLAGDFVQTAPSGAVVTGKVFMRRPGQIRFDYDDPSPITIVATGGMVYVENKELETTDSYPLKKTPLRFLLSKKIDIGDAALKSVERGADSVAVTYASTGEETEGEITLVLSAPTLSIEQWAVRDPQGGVTVVALHGVAGGGALENRLFRAPDAGGAFIND